MTMITPSYLGETIEYSSLHACRSTLEDPTVAGGIVDECGVDVLNCDFGEFGRHSKFCVAWRSNQPHTWL